MGSFEGAFPLSAKPGVAGGTSGVGMLGCGMLGDALERGGCRGGGTVGEEKREGGVCLPGRGYFFLYTQQPMPTLLKQLNGGEQQPGWQIPAL